ncbi:MAG: OsmC family protein [Bacteroidota bacterium]
MATVETYYIGELRTEATHLRSGNKLITDAPVDNQGKGEYFSPTDLVATALGSCMITVMGIAARTHKFDIDGSRLVITKIMTSEAPRRIGEIVVEITFPEIEYSDQQKKILDYVVKTCPVALSLHPDIKQTVSLIFR